MARVTSGRPNGTLEDIPSQELTPETYARLAALAEKRAVADHKRGKVETNVQRTRKLLFDNDLPSSAAAYLVYCDLYFASYKEL